MEDRRTHHWRQHAIRLFAEPSSRVAMRVTEFGRALEEPDQFVRKLDKTLCMSFCQAIFDCQIALCAPTQLGANAPERRP